MILTKYVALIGDSCNHFRLLLPKTMRQAHLQKADHFADLYNWADAGPLFLIADKQLPPGSPEQIHAHLGYLRSDDGDPVTS